MGDKVNTKLSAATAVLSVMAASLAIAGKPAPRPVISPAFLIDNVQNYKERVTTFAMDGTGLTTLVGPYNHAPNPQHIANAQWSPDGRSIVYWDRWSGLLVRADSRTGAVQSTRNTALALFPPRLDWSNTAVGTCGDLIVFSEASDYKADGFSREFDLFVAGPTLQQSAKVALHDDDDDGIVGNESDPEMLDPAWSRDGRFIVATNNSDRSSAIYRVNCTYPMNISVASETPLILDFGGPTSSIGDYSWSSSGRYIAMIAKTGTDMNLWVADLGEPDELGYPLGYPNALAPPMYRLTGANRPFGTATDRFEGVSFSPTSTILAFAGRESGVHTINVGNCVAALAAASSVATDCAVTLVPADVNPHNIDWRPNWPTPLQ